VNKLRWPRKRWRAGRDQLRQNPGQRIRGLDQFSQSHGFLDLVVTNEFAVEFDSVRVCPLRRIEIAGRVGDRRFFYPSEH
jgi:hypothetical protein